MTLIVMAAIWKQISYNFLFFLAGLQSIPKSLIEAAAIDGAHPWRRFWTIQFPLLSPTTFFLLVINIVYAFFDTFAIVDATTHGGPGQATSILVYKVYYDGFKAMDAVVQGMASAIWSDFNFYGPIVTAPRIFPAVAAAQILLTTLVYDETGKIPDNPNIPIRKYFADFLEKLTAGAARK